MTDITMDVDTKALRQRILTMAIQGKLTDQRKEDGNAQDLYNQIQEEKQKLIKEKKIKKTKKLPVIAEDEIPFDIPENWMWVRLGEMILNHIGGGTPDKSNEAYWNGDIPWMSVKDVHQDSMYADRTIDSITPAGLENSSSNLIEANRLIVVMRMAVGRAVINKLPVAINQDLRALFFRDNVTQEYILRIFKILKFETSGMTVKGIKLWVLLNTPIPLPPLTEQKRIVEKVSALFAQLDAIDKAYEEYRELQQTMKSRLLEQAIQGKLTDQRKEDGNAQDLYNQIQEEKQRLIKEKKIKKEKPLPEITADEIPFEIPENWMWVRLGNLTSKIGAGNTPKGGKNSGVYKESGVEFIREMNVYNDGLHYDGMVYISNELAKTRTGSAVVAGDILLNITGGSIGRCALVPDTFALGNVNQHVLIIRNIVAYLREYMHLVLCSPLVQRYINASAVGDKAGLSASKTKGFLIPLPPLAEQKRIVEKLNKLLPLCEA